MEKQSLHRRKSINSSAGIYINRKGKKMLKVDGFDDAIIGVATPWVNHSRTDVLVYDAERIRAILMKDGMTSEEAREYIEFNIEGAYVGEATPIICWTEDHIDV